MSRFARLFTGMKKILAVLFTAIIFASLAFKVYAINPTPTPCPTDTMSTDLGCIHTAEPVLFVSDIYALGLWLIGFIGIIFIIVGGYFVMTSHGNVEQLQKGKSFIMYAIIGLLLAVFGFVFIQIIAGQILRIPGFG